LRRAGVAIRQVGPERARNAIEIGLHLRRRYSGTGAPDHREILIAPAAVAILHMVEGHPQLRGQAHVADRRVRKARPRRHHSDDDAGERREGDRLPDDAGIGAEPATPQRVAEDDHTRRAGDAVSRREPAADRRRGAQHLEQIRRCLIRVDALRLALGAGAARAGQIAWRRPDRRDRLERAIALLDVSEFSRRHCGLRQSGVLVPDHMQTARVGIRNRVDHR